MKRLLPILAILFLAVPGHSAPPPDLIDRYEVLAKDFVHTVVSTGPSRGRDVPAYQARAEVVAVVRKPTVGVFALRGNNNLLVRHLRVIVNPQWTGGPIEPLRSSLSLGRLEMEIENLELSTPPLKDGSRGLVWAESALVTGEHIELRRGFVQITGQKTSFMRAWLSDEGNSLIIPGPKTLNWTKGI